MKIDWQENGIVVTAIAVAIGAALVVAEVLVERRMQSPIVVTIDSGSTADDEGDDRDGVALATVPLYGSPGELRAHANLLL
ncbi:MAG: hypothetical protein ACRER4_07055, partial [Steroidobacteraceae bacterium]